jgi:hypothetical protein
MYSEYEEEEYNKEVDKCEEFKIKYSPNHDDWVGVNENEIDMGDIIYVDYMPVSQKDLYTHTPECGKVIDIKIVKIDTSEEKVFSESYDNHMIQITILNQHNKEIPITKGGLCYYSVGYFKNIKKLIK